MLQPVVEDSSTSNTGIDWKKLRLRLSFSRSVTSEGATSGNDSDESKIVPDLTTSSTDSESPCIVSPSGSLSNFEVVTYEDLCYEGEVPSPLTQPCVKLDEVDFKKYRDKPLDLTHDIERILNYPLSCGGFSNVWKCKLTHFSRNDTKMPLQDVAVKVVRMLSRNPEDVNKLIKKLRQEVYIWQTLEHSNILPLYGTAEGFDTVPALVCPWMENGSLHRYLDDMWNMQLPPKMQRLFLLLLQVVSGLEYLHEKNIIHGDLMAYNVLIDENGDALLADFGMSRLLADHETSFFKSHSPGAIRWAAPEIISLNPENPDEKVSEPNRASDIYSFGCIMVQVLSGEIPYWNIKCETAVIVAKSKGTAPTRPTLHAIADVYWCYLERCWSPCVETRPLVGEVLEYVKAEYGRQKSASRAGRSRQ